MQDTQVKAREIDGQDANTKKELAFLPHMSMSTLCIGRAMTVWCPKEMCSDI